MSPGSPVTPQHPPNIMFKVIVTHLGCFDSQILLAMLQHEGLRFTIEENLALVMRTLHGKCNPTNGVFVEAPDGSTIKNIYELVRYIEQHGLKQI